MESSAFQQLCYLFHEMNILCRVCFNQSWFSSLDSIRLHCSAVCVTLIYCHLTTPEILLADLFSFLTYFTFTTWLLCTTFCFFSSLFCYFIHLRSIICSLETKLNCFALPTAPQWVRRRLLFVTLCPSRYSRFYHYCCRATPSVSSGRGWCLSFEIILSSVVFSVEKQK